MQLTKQQFKQLIREELQNSQLPIPKPEDMDGWKLYLRARAGLDGHVGWAAREPEYRVAVMIDGKRWTRFAESGLCLTAEEFPAWFEHVRYSLYIANHYSELDSLGRGGESVRLMREPCEKTPFLQV